jgi:hypothetical protein
LQASGYFGDIAIEFDLSALPFGPLDCDYGQHGDDAGKNEQ